MHYLVIEDLLMDEEPAARMHEQTRLRASVVTLSLDEVSHGHFTRGKQIDTGDRLVANGYVSSDSVHSQSRESAAVLEQGAVGRAHCEFNLGEFGHHAEEAHLLLRHQH